MITPDEHEPPRGQEVIFYSNDNNDDDVESATANPTTTSANDNPDDAAAGAGVDAPANAKIKPGVKKAALGLIILSATGVAAGAGIAAYTKSTNQTNLELESEKMAWHPSPSSRSGKSGKADFYECVVEPLILLDQLDCEDLPDDPTKKEFDEYVWKPYLKECGGFWSDVFYLLTRGVLYFIKSMCDSMCQVTGFVSGQLQYLCIFPDECLSLLPINYDGVDVEFRVSSIVESEENIMTFNEQAEMCGLAMLDAARFSSNPLLSEVTSALLNERRRRLVARSTRGLASAYKEEHFQNLITQEKKSLTDDEKIEIYSTWEDTPSTTLMWHLVTTNQVEDLESWLDQDPGAAWLRSEDGRGPMWWAAESNNQDIVVMLKKMSVPHTDKDQDGLAPDNLLKEHIQSTRRLASASKEGHFENLITQEKKSLTDVQKMKIYSTWEDTPSTTLMWHLVTTNQVEDVVRWLDQDPGAAWLRSEDGRGPMWWAAELNNHDIFVKLKKMGVPHTDKDKNGLAPDDLLIEE